MVRVPYRTRTVAQIISRRKCSQLRKRLLLRAQREQLLRNPPTRNW